MTRIYAAPAPIICAAIIGRRNGDFMKYGIYFAYWEKEWNTEIVPYIRKVKELGFDILEISLSTHLHKSCRS